MLRLDASLEEAVYDLVEVTPPHSSDGMALSLIVGANEHVADALLELLGLPLDDAARVVSGRARAVGTNAFREAMGLVVRRLGQRGVAFDAEHVETLMLAGSNSLN